MELTGFTSALSYTRVRDFAYHDRHPLHYGVRENSNTSSSHKNGSDEPSPSMNAYESDKEQEIDQYQQETEQEESQTRRKSKNDIYRRAVSLFDFEPENDNETRSKEGQISWISYRHGQGWLVAENLETGETGSVPEEYVQVLPENDEEWIDA